MSESDRAAVESAAAELRAALAADDLGLIEGSTDALTKTAYRLAEEVYKETAHTAGSGNPRGTGQRAGEGARPPKRAPRARRAGLKTWTTRSSNRNGQARFLRGPRASRRARPGTRSRRAYRQLAIKHHPDRNPDDRDAEEKFKEATEAYEILADDRKRQAYDQYGFAGLNGMGQPTAQDFSTIFQGFEDIFGDVSGIFDSFFGGGGSRRRSGRGRGGQRGSDLRYDMEISFLEAAFGAKKEVSYPRAERCDVCNGTGSDKGSGRKLCPTCGGSGQVRRNSGFFSIASTCPSCGGEGEIIERPCTACRGAGTVRRNRTITITIPAGIEDGKRLSVSGQGDAGANGSPDGDLYVFLRVQPHECLRAGRQGRLLRHTHLHHAGGPGRGYRDSHAGREDRAGDGPPGTQNGRVLRLRGEGIPELHSASRRGDMYIKIVVRVPTKVNARARELLKELATVSGEEQSPKPIPLSELKQP